MSPEDASAKAAAFLSSLRSGGGSAGEGPSTARRIEELEAKLDTALKAAGGPGEGEPPRAPTELTLFIHTRMELLERKLQEAQSEALRANLLLHEREAAQRKAQKEVEDLFHTIREQQRSAQWDGALREELAASHRRLESLEARLRESELRMVPAEDVLRALQDAQRAEEMRRTLEERLQNMRPPAAPGPEMIERASSPSPQPSPPGGGGTQTAGGRETDAMALLIAKVGELEGALQEARRERDEERARRAEWEKDMVGSFARAQQHWRRSGSVELVVEGALQTMALAMREREEGEAELKQVLEQAAEQPPGAAADPVLRARIAAARARLANLEETLRQQMNLVQAWIEQNRSAAH